VRPYPWRCSRRPRRRQRRGTRCLRHHPPLVAPTRLVAPARREGLLCCAARPDSPRRRVPTRRWLKRAQPGVLISRTRPRRPRRATPRLATRSRRAAGCLPGLAAVRARPDVTPPLTPVFRCCRALRPVRRRYSRDVRGGVRAPYGASPLCRSNPVGSSAQRSFLDDHRARGTRSPALCSPRPGEVGIAASADSTPSASIAAAMSRGFAPERRARLVARTGLLERSGGAFLASGSIRVAPS
jgi:hypothetical protein